MALNIDQEDVDPRMERVVQTLGAKLEGFKKLFLSDRVVKDIDALLKDHRGTWRMRGVDVPVMVAVILPQVGAIEVLRADLHPFAIQRAVIGLVQKYPTVTKEELAKAVFRVYPHYVKFLQSQHVLHSKPKAAPAEMH